MILERLLSNSEARELVQLAADVVDKVLDPIVEHDRTTFGRRIIDPSGFVVSAGPHCSRWRLHPRHLPRCGTPATSATTASSATYARPSSLRSSRHQPDQRLVIGRSLTCAGGTT